MATKLELGKKYRMSQNIIQDPEDNTVNLFKGEILEVKDKDYLLENHIPYATVLAIIYCEEGYKEIVALEECLARVVEDIE
ncbi:hypothetical protein [Catellicoccus marimammalium]|uniref:Uncharacterized protein n=1 Tax=Catellicoccus marimammalium M35/04/3 TaxID=1234409 RepID=K8ZMH2_9ENTE|nr:hypothetical protein [Catellicoccus marimammalium]EKU27738.1 hypothetical protein C683_0319 [Catellicoccus marimammalium M35/04/3]